MSRHAPSKCPRAYCPICNAIMYAAMLGPREGPPRPPEPDAPPGPQVQAIVAADPPFWCETCGGTHPLSEHRRCRGGSRAPAT
jgi:hypothetical protein